MGFFNSLKDEFVRNFIEKGRWKSLFKGLGNTLLITLFAVIIGIAIGIIIAVIRTTYDKNAESLKRTAE